MLVRRLPLAVAAVTVLLAVGACDPIGGDGPEQQFYAGHGGGEAEDSERLSLTGADGSDAGVVEVVAHDDYLEVHVEAEGLEPGFHGLHVHSVGACETDSADPEDPATTGDFLSAGGHVSVAGQDHGEHAGDMPSLLALSDGTATMHVDVDTLTLEELRDEDGSAFVVHSGPDNFANIPERYAPEGPDEETLAAGDSGDRIACGVVEPG